MIIAQCSTGSLYGVEKMRNDFIDCLYCGFRKYLYIFVRTADKSIYHLSASMYSSFSAIVLKSFCTYNRSLI